MKKILYFTICIFFLLNGNSYSKSLPPGSAVSIPANILILLDRTNSMTHPADASSSVDSMRAPMGVAQDPNTGHYFIPQILDFGTLLWNGGANDGGFSNNKTPASTWGLWKSAQCHHVGTMRGCGSGNYKSPFKNVWGIEVYKDWLYQVTKDETNSGARFANISQLTPTTSNKVDRRWRGHYTTDNPCFTRNNHTDCREVYKNGKQFHHNLKIDIQNGIFYGVAEDGLVIRDLTVDNPSIGMNRGQLNRGTMFNDTEATFIKCKYNNSGNLGGSRSYTHSSFNNKDFRKIWAKSGSALAIGSSNEYMYISKGSSIAVYELKTTGTATLGKGCPTSLNAPIATFTNPCGATFGLITNPGDSSILYSSGYFLDKVCKMELNAGRNGIIPGTDIKIGIGDNYSTSTIGQIYVSKPTQLAFDNNGHLLVTNENRLEILVLDEDLNFVRVFGGGGVSRLIGAMDAIRNVVTDSTISSGANIGFGVWSKYRFSDYSPSGKLYRHWDTVRNKAVPCDKMNCLLSRVDEHGSTNTYNILNKNISTHLHTDAPAFANMARDYFTHPTDSPVKGSTCETNYIIVIGDGGWKSTGGGSSDPHVQAMNTISSLFTGIPSPHTGNTASIKTIAVAYGNGIVGSALNKFNALAVAGSGDPAAKAIIALDAQDLKIELHSLITAIINENLSYTAPAITGRIDTGGSLYQAQFDYYSDQEWEGSLKKSTLDAAGNISATIDWEASAKLKIKGSANRKIWSVIPGTNYYPGYNNFTDSNKARIKTDLFENFGNVLNDYHNDSLSAKLTNGRCGKHGHDVVGVEDGNMDDAAGLINFIRGQDYFDYKGNCDIYRDRDNMLADIYNSQIVVVGNPDANINYSNNIQESYWRSLNNYTNGFALSAAGSRTKVVYAGANNGILHAFRADNGEELWGFVPPLIAGKLPLMINKSLNRGGSHGGGSNPIFAVDGSPVVHDVYMKGLSRATGSFESNNSWRTILMIPYGRGGAGFSVLDVTIPEEPLHLYSILNDTIEGYVYHVDHQGIFKKYSHSSTTYKTEDFLEIEDAILNSTVYSGNTLTLPGNISASSSLDQKVYIDGEVVCSTNCFTALGGNTKVSLGVKTVVYDGNPSTTVSNSSVKAAIMNPIENAGKDYNYRYLAETWSAPRIFRMPNNGSGDTNIADDTYVAVMGGGYGSVQAGIGSNLLVINLQDGKLLKQIDIQDEPGNGIINSAPNTPVVITSDTARGVNYSGAIVYINDVEGKITKINLTNMTTDGSGSSINLYDKTTIMSLNSNSENARYMFHSMEASIGGDTGDFWLYGGTGNYLNLNDGGIKFPDKVSNILMGIKDKNFPNFKIVDASGINDLTHCKDTTGTTTAAGNCPDATDLGWYIKLDPNSPTTSTRTKVTAEPTIFKGVVYYPIYKPASINSCSLGESSICAADDECGTNISSELDPTGATTLPNSCYKVGTGAISKIVIFGDDLYANIAGESTVGSRKDIVIIQSATGDANSFRLNWRENF